MKTMEKIAVCFSVDGNKGTITVAPEDVEGTFDDVKSIVAAWNKEKKHGHNNWQIPAPEDAEKVFSTVFSADSEEALSASFNRGAKYWTNVTDGGRYVRCVEAKVVPDNYKVSCAAASVRRARPVVAPVV